MIEIENEFKEIMFKYIRENNLNIYKLKNGSFNISKKKTIKDINLDEAKNLIWLDGYINWKITENQVSFFKYMHQNLSKEGKDKLFDMSSFLLPVSKCFNAYLEIDKKLALDFIKNSKRRFSFYSSSGHKRLEPKEFEIFINKIVKLSGIEAPQVLSSYIKNHDHLFERGMFSQSYKFILKKIIEDNFSQDDYSLFPAYELRLKKDSKESILYEIPNEEIFIIRLKTDLLYTTISLDVKPDELYKKYDKLINNISDYLNNEAREFKISRCEESNKNEYGHKLATLMVYTEKNAPKNKQQLEEFVMQAINIQAENPNIIDNKNDVNMMLRNLYLIGNLNKTLNSKIQVKEDTIKKHKL